MMTAEEYIQSLRDLRPRRVYAFGEKIEDCVGHPLIRPSINCCAMTYKLAEMPEYRELMVTASSFTGKPVNRFCHLHQSTADLVNKVKMQRLCGSMTGACFQRCVGMDALNAVFSTTYEIDALYGTEYHRRFVEFIKEWQEKDWTVDGAMTDPKGNRGLAPYAQKDPDMFLRVVERREDGIVVRGAKMHQTGALTRLFRDAPAVTAVALPAFHYQCLAMLLQPIIVVANMTFQSVGASGRATFLACCRQGVFFIPLILILPRTHGLFGVEICQPIADVLTFLVSLPFLLAFLQQLGRMDDAEQSKTAS